MARAVCDGKPDNHPLHNFVRYGHNLVTRGVLEVTKRCTGCGRKVTTTQ